MVFGVQFVLLMSNNSYTESQVLDSTVILSSSQPNLLPNLISKNDGTTEKLLSSQTCNNTTETTYFIKFGLGYPNINVVNFLGA